MKWEEELASLRAQKAKMSENSDEQTTDLSILLDESTAIRDSLKEELRKAKEEATKEREELEAAQKKLIKKVERVQKSKQDLEDIKKDMEGTHALVMPTLTHSIIQHASDYNPWSLNLEEDRKFIPKKVLIPDEGLIKGEQYMQQLKVLSKLLNEQNRSLDALLQNRGKEKQEVLSVELGKLKKRDRTKAEEEEGAESSEEEGKQGQDKKSAASQKLGWQSAVRAKK